MKRRAGEGRVRRRERRTLRRGITKDGAKMVMAQSGSRVHAAFDAMLDAQLDLERDLQGELGRRPEIQAAITAVFAPEPA